MRAGKINQLAEFFKRSDKQSDSGAPVAVFTSIGHIWCSITQASAGLTESGDREQSVNSYDIECRFRKDLSAKDELNWRGKRLKITSIDDSDPKNAKLLITAESDPNQ